MASYGEKILGMAKRTNTYRETRKVCLMAVWLIIIGTLHGGENCEILYHEIR